MVEALLVGVGVVGGIAFVVGGVILAIKKYSPRS